MYNKIIETKSHSFKNTALSIIIYNYNTVILFNYNKNYGTFKYSINMFYKRNICEIIYVKTTTFNTATNSMY